MSETKVPTEFEWIKPGVQVDLKQDAWHGCDIDQTLTVISEPYLPPNFDHWVVECKPDFGLLMWCDELMPAKNPTITLTMTREQAEAISEELGGLISYIKQPLGDLYQQIEEKLK